ncbi:DUF6705 family protein [Flavobacterium tibetense]|uniref:DUF6705 domain-containing protein n=1 Tax=Flavobacterium tibetense TaxID=2233533 RepID=A0A365P247_9FLAO|nr:DUF6705 family protein [Flavobacterium tibetense]RBA28609.1 hypothetical protein DPN68_06235 [Flavobacterium tibetense]
MKKIVILIVYITFSIGCKAQILDIYETLPSETPLNAYLKDTQNFQNQFVGTWVYQNGQEYLEVRFIKREMFWRPAPTQFYEDVLVGEYKYIDSNGIEKVNSLSNLNLNHDNLFNYNLYSGAKLVLDRYPLCPSCPIGTERLYMHFDEPANDDNMLSAGFVIRRVIENGVEKLKVQFINKSSKSGRSKADFYVPSTFTNFSLPYGDYTLIKQ